MKGLTQYTYNDKNYTTNELGCELLWCSKVPNRYYQQFLSFINIDVETGFINNVNPKRYVSLNPMRNYSMQMA